MEGFKYQTYVCWSYLVSCTATNDNRIEQGYYIFEIINTRYYYIAGNKVLLCKRY